MSPYSGPAAFDTTNPFYAPKRRTIYHSSHLSKGGNTYKSYPKRTKKEQKRAQPGFEPGTCHRHDHVLP
jgi:hypothetical protein